MSVGTAELAAFNKGYDKTIEVVEQGAEQGRHHFTIRVLISDHCIGRGYWYRQGSEMAVRFCENNWHKANRQAIGYRQSARDISA